MGRIETDRTNVETPFKVNPFLLNKIPKGLKVDYVADNDTEVYMGNKRRVLIVHNKLEEDRMENKVLEFLTYLILLSTCDIEMDNEEVESLIQGDFIEFGNFINL